MEREAQRRRAEALDRFWDDLIAQGAVERPDDVGAAHAQVARWLTELGDVPGLAAARERVWERLPHDISTEHPEETTMYPPISLQLSQSTIGPNGLPRALPGSLTPPGIFGERRRWATAQLATAALLLLTLISSLFVMGPWRLRPGPGLPLVAIQADATPIPVSEADWPTYRGNPWRSGVSASPGPVGEPAELWRFQAGGHINSEPAIVGGMLYVGSDDGNLYALDAVTGAEQWRFAANDALSSSPAVTNGVVYIGSGSGTLYAVDAASGEERWQAPGARANAAPAVINGVVFTGGEDGNLYAFDAASGTENWRAPLGAAASRSASVAGELVFIGSADGILHAIDVTNGEERWQFQTAGGTLGTVAIVDGVVYQCTFEGDANALYAVGAATGEEIWRFASETGDAVWLPVVHEGTVYVGSDDGNVYALDAADGQERWRFATGDAVNSSPTLAGGVLYAASQDRNLYAIDAASGDELWRFALDGGVDKGPTISNGIAYVGTTVGTLYAIAEASDAITPISASATEDASDQMGATETAAPPSDATVVGNTATLPGASGPDAALIAFAGEITDTADPLDGPEGVAVDGHGNLYVVDSLNDRIRVFDRDGAPLATWGESGKDPGQFQFHSGDQFFGDVAIGPDGAVYVVEAVGNRIQKLSPDGEIITTWGEFGQEPGQFNRPVAMTIDAQSNLYVVDSRNARIQVFDADGQFLRMWGSHGSAPGQFDDPFELAMLPDGTVLVSDAGGALLHFDDQGTFLGPFAVDAAIGQPRNAFGITADHAGNIFLADYDGNRLHLLDADGALRASWGETGAQAGQFHGAGYLTLDAPGFLYVGDENNGRVQKFRLLPPLAVASAATAPGEFLWRTTGGSEPFNEVTNLVVAPDGNLWVPDNGNSQFQIFAPDGTHLETWGEAGSEDGQFDLTRPDGEGLSSLAFAPDGGFYIADSNNSRVQQFDAARSFVRAWGGRGSGDGQFVEPIDVDVDAEGNVYVIDNRRDDIQTFDSQGNFLFTFAGHGTEDGQLDNASWGAFDPEGNYWVADQDNARVQQFAPDGTFLRSITSEDLDGEELDDPQIVAFDAEGRMFVSEGYLGHGIHVFDREGQYLMTLTGDDMGGTRFGGVYGIALDGQGNLYVDDWVENEYSAVQKFRLPPVAP